MHETNVPLNNHFTPLILNICLRRQSITPCPGTVFGLLEGASDGSARKGRVGNTADVEVLVTLRVR